jgi:hypothetical protein
MAVTGKASCSCTKTHGGLVFQTAVVMFEVLRSLTATLHE